MLTPEGPPPYVAPIQPLEEKALDDDLPHIISINPNELFETDRYVIVVIRKSIIKFNLYILFFYNICAFF